MLGAAFAWLTPWQPFLLPDLACLLASLAMFQAIARRLAPGWPPGVAAVCFTVAVLSGRTAVAVWVVPWSTTGSAPFQFAAVLLALLFAERPGPGRAALLGGAIATVAGFRPSDAAVLLAAAGPAGAWALWRAQVGWRGWAGCAAAGLGGLVVASLPAAAAHLAVFGWHAGPYVGGSAAIGLEWRLLPMRWVMIVAGARPLLPEGVGLAAGLLWVAPGIGGLVLVLLTGPRRNLASVLAAAVVALHWALYLAYRDLQPYGLWRYYNLHYFKWTFPFLVFWAAQLVAALWTRPARRAALAACAAACLSLAWRPVLRDRVAQPAQAGDGGVMLPAGSVGLDRAVLLDLRGSWDALYFGAFTLRVGGRTFLNKPDFKMLPVPGGALLLPLRVLPGGPAVLALPDGVTFGGGMLTTARQAIVFGLPCGVLNRLRPACG